MAKFIVFSIGLLWACLLLISWGQADLQLPEDSLRENIPQVTSIPQH